MELTSTASTRIVLALLCGLFAANVYRAGTQSITTEEALAFDQRIRPPVRDILPNHRVGNHLLLTLLIKRSVGLFRLSEFSFRLPSLLCGALYLWAVYRVSRRIFGTGLLFVAAVAVLVLNPLALDGFFLANANGMALAFWMCGVLFMIEYLESSKPVRLRNLNLAGLCLGLSVAADPAFAVPAVGLGMSFLIASAMKGRLCWPAFTERLITTAVITGFVLLVIPLSHAGPGNFGWGGKNLNETARAVAAGFYFVPMLSLLALILASKFRWPPIQGAVLLLAAVVVARYLFEFSLGPYRDWPEDAGAKSLVAVLRRDAQDRHIRIGASPPLAPILTFYRARYRLANWEPIWQLPLNGDFDYYVLVRADVVEVKGRHLQVLYDDGKLLMGRRTR